MEQHRAFFAFGRDQYRAKALRCIEYVVTRYNIICPVVNDKPLLATITKIIDDGIAKDISDNGIDNIIKRELANHEFLYTYDIADTFEALKHYGITRDQVQEVATTVISDDHDWHRKVFRIESSGALIVHSIRDYSPNVVITVHPTLSHVCHRPTHVH